MNVVKALARSAVGGQEKRPIAEDVRTATLSRDSLLRTSPPTPAPKSRVLSQLKPRSVKSWLWTGVFSFGLMTFPSVKTSSADETKVDSAKPTVAFAKSDSDTEQHPLTPILERAREALDRFDSEIHGYTCLLIKRETIEGKLTPRQAMRLKVREPRTKNAVDANGSEDAKESANAPIVSAAAYAKFLKPSSVAGREILFVDGQMRNRMLVRRGGPRLPNLTLKVRLDSPLAAQESNHTIANTGFRFLLSELIKRLETEIERDRCVVRFYSDAAIGKRPCDHIEVRQPRRDEDLDYQLARVYVDHEWDLPLYFASYGWPKEADGESKPVLIEEYAFTQVQLNPGLTAADFDRSNPTYQFRPEDDDVPSVTVAESSIAP